MQPPILLRELPESLLMRPSPNPHKTQKAYGITPAPMPVPVAPVPLLLVQNAAKRWRTIRFITSRD